MIYQSEILERWEHPESYAGFSPTDDYLIYTQYRNSDTMSACNYKLIFEDLKQFVIDHELPEPPNNPCIESSTMGWVYDFRASHWAVGWVEYILIRQDAPKMLIQYAEHIISKLSGYPVYDDDRYSEWMFEAISDYWQSLSLSDKIELCAYNDDSIFAARYDYPSCNVELYLQETLE